MFILRGTQVSSPATVYSDSLFARKGGVPFHEQLKAEQRCSVGLAPQASHYCYTASVDFMLMSKT